MISVDIELALVGLVAMLEPATLVSSAFAVVIGDRPLRTGFWFYVGGLAVTLAVGIAAAFVLGNVAASRTSTPKTWVSVFNLVAGVLLLAYVAWSLRRPPNPQKMQANVSLLPLSLALVFLLLAPARTTPLLRAARSWIELHARAVVLVILIALAASLLRDGIAGLTG
jgi:Sap, sulfolipid-1-addressing protein